MSRVKLSAQAIGDAKRLYDFLSQYDLTVADNSSRVLVKALQALEQQPLMGAPLPDRPGFRKMVVDFGASGYLIFHKRYESTDVNVVVRIIHQKEWYDATTLGLADDGSA